MSVDQPIDDLSHSSAEDIDNPAYPAKKGIKRQAPIPTEFDDYWAYKISEAAKKKVFSYFAVLGVLVSIVITLFGVDRIRTLVDEQYVKQLEQREKEASNRVNELTKQFESKLTTLQSRVETRSQEFHRIVGISLSQVSSRSESISEVQIDLSSEIGPIRDQGREGISTGFSAAYALTAENKRVTGRIDLFSVRSIFVEAQRRDEWPGESYEGSSILGAMKALKEVGAYLEEDWPIERKSDPLPGMKPANRITTYSKIANERTDLLIEALQNRKTVVIAFHITDDIANVTEDGKITFSPESSPIGVHAVCLVGYDSNTDEFKFANSWGTGWGSSGFGYIRRSDLQNRLSDAYTLTL